MNLRFFFHRHYGDAVQAAGVVMMALGLLVLQSGTAAILTSSSGVVLLGGAIALQTRHRTGPLCEECVRVVTLNASEEIENNRRWRLALTVFHRAFATPARMRLVYGTQTVLLLLGLPPLYSLAGLENALPVSRVFLIAGLTTVAGVQWLLRTHNRFRPWCPHCRHGGRGPRPSTPVSPDGPGPLAPV
ncbi:hypothetical protein AB0G74_08535 [Streptomyces sp. NPDC020875]|uniref:hypothetical protein n=1 Tax=Streptomyces sp. NPDC020875 TaxID=3154898 RepID=UPI0033C66C1E